MKKVFAILMMMIMLCAVALPVHAENEMAAGGWNTAEETVVTEEAAEALKKATEGLVGCAYEPVAVLGTQVVAGINYCILCKLTPVVPDAVPHYAFVYVWQKLDGTADLLGVKDIEPDMNAEAVGGWTAAEDNRVISLHGAEGAMVLVINSFGAYTARQVLENLLPGGRAQLALAFTDIAFSEEGTIILCGEREAVRYTFTAEGREYHQYIIPVGEDLWYLTANVTPDTLTDRLIASIAEK